MKTSFALLALSLLGLASVATAQVNYAVSGSTAYVTNSPGASGAIAIASTYNGYPVTSIGERAFSGCTNLTSATIPNSVTIIGDRAFQNCTNLTSATIGNGVISIGGGAFHNCTALRSVSIPDSVTQIGTTLYGGPLGGAFQSCTRLTNVIIGHSVTNLGFAAFYGCTNLTRLTFPASLANIGAYTFLGCSRLTNFTFLGNAPQLVYDIEAGGAHFAGVGAGAKAYYYCGTTGWGPILGPTFGGLPTVMLCAPGIAPGSAGMKPGGFGFTLTRLTNQTIVVEASANLVNWQPIWTNPPPGTSANFVDPEWLNHSNRFYRARAD